MRTPFPGAPLIVTIRAAITEAAPQVVQLASLVAFLFVSSTPHYALAFSEGLELNQQPLEFTRDPELSDTTLVGIEAFPQPMTAEAYLTAAPTPTATPPTYLTAGTSLRVLATAYSSTADQTDGNPFITASGSRVHPGTLAANFLPFGSQVQINGKTYTVEDRLSARYNGTYVVDIWFPTREQALAFGIRMVEMEITSLP